MLCCGAFYLKIFLREFGHFFNKYFCGYVSKFSHFGFDDALFRVGVNSLEVLSVLKLHLGFQCRQLVDICVKDLGVGGRWRFVVTYFLLSHKFNFRVLVRTKLQDNFVLRSATALYRGAG